MARLADEPWTQAVLATVEPRREERVLALLPSATQVQALASRVGIHGAVCAVQPLAAIGTTIAALGLPQVTVHLGGAEDAPRIGTFDVVLLQATQAPRWPLGAYPELLRQNLRPGGRFVLDLPGPDPVPCLRRAWTTLGFPPDQLTALAGPTGQELAFALGNAGLRDVRTLLGTELIGSGSAFELAEDVSRLLRLDDGEHTDLARALVTTLGAPDGVDFVVHRTRVQGRR